ncbi:hypothetical protein ACQP00_40660 [Dactylosporangium sp. CS-047395]|uniref:hypothetical protein n=1 Tax=Dactylosporangium sp. CS-047395 TaxID=3239936 RepID=UPI003D950763
MRVYTVNPSTGESESPGAALGYDRSSRPAAILGVHDQSPDSRLWRRHGPFAWEGIAQDLAVGPVVDNAFDRSATAGGWDEDDLAACARRCASFALLVGMVERVHAVAGLSGLPELTAVQNVWFSDA